MKKKSMCGQEGDVSQKTTAELDITWSWIKRIKSRSGFPVILFMYKRLVRGAMCQVLFLYSLSTGMNRITPEVSEPAREDYRQDIAPVESRH